jgi:hypothetical protein
MTAIAGGDRHRIVVEAAMHHLHRQSAERLVRASATDLTNILGKLDVSSRTVAVAHAMRTGLV